MDTRRRHYDRRHGDSAGLTLCEDSSSRTITISNSQCPTVSINSSRPGRGRGRVIVSLGRAHRPLRRGNVGLRYQQRDVGDQSSHRYACNHAVAWRRRVRRSSILGRLAVISVVPSCTKSTGSVRPPAPITGPGDWSRVIACAAALPGRSHGGAGCAPRPRVATPTLRREALAGLAWILRVADQQTHLIPGSCGRRHPQWVIDRG